MVPPVEEAASLGGVFELLDPFAERLGRSGTGPAAAVETVQILVHDHMETGSIALF